ncbi:hypothetical protein RAJCM14343_1399 [Rhodococcus aetherivorans]|uniref:Uncharacterized protein n=1 Tax=Rhodococcus aetherivorans TaxID=191292 RepID=A0ABQ0YHZ7_9NOCA|nr:hypothetical protein RAJCM14343_1399 [Rhodococcus aetherivorans]CCW11142.1 hypothetical protein EBESD8_16780 [Rhodococcus aetherivorans]
MPSGTTHAVRTLHDASIRCGRVGPGPATVITEHNVVKDNGVSGAHIPRTLRATMPCSWTIVSVYRNRHTRASARVDPPAYTKPRGKSTV